MAEKPVESFQDLHKLVQGYGRKTMIYRGVTDVLHQLEHFHK